MGATKERVIHDVFIGASRRLHKLNDLGRRDRAVKKRALPASELGRMVELSELRFCAYGE